MRSPRILPALAAAAALLAAGCTSTVSGSPHASISKDCAGGTVIRPTGGPYCYVAQAGFQQTSGVQLGNGQFASGVAVDNANQLIAAVFPAQADLDQLSDDSLVQALDKLIGATDDSSFQLTNPHGELRKVPAGRAVGYHATATSNGQSLQIDLYLVIKGRTKVQLNCQYTDQKDKVQSGCDSVLQSMRITGQSS